MKQLRKETWMSEGDEFLEELKEKKGKNFKKILETEKHGAIFKAYTWENSSGDRILAVNAHAGSGDFLTESIEIYMLSVEENLEETTEKIIKGE